VREAGRRASRPSEAHGPAVVSAPAGKKDDCCGREISVFLFPLRLRGLSLTGKHRTQKTNAFQVCVAAGESPCAPVVRLGRGVKMPWTGTPVEKKLLNTHFLY